VRKTISYFHWSRPFNTGVLAILLLTAFQAAGASSPVDAVLKADPPPAGVVFEIVTGKEDSLTWALPLVRTYIGQIRQHHPQMPIAIVTHGREMFSLQNNNEAKSAAKVRQISQQLVKDGVTLHVCGTYAGYKGLSEEDFPEFVNVAAAGPAQINDYIAVGYQRIRLKKPPPTPQRD